VLSRQAGRGLQCHGYVWAKPNSTPALAIPQLHAVLCHVLRDINFTYHGPVPGSHYTDFDELGPQAPRTPLEYKLLGFSEEVFPGKWGAQGRPA
jgi:hypothetical protein